MRLTKWICRPAAGSGDCWPRSPSRPARRRWIRSLFPGLSAASHRGDRPHRDPHHRQCIEGRRRRGEDTTPPERIVAYQYVVISTQSVGTQPIRPKAPRCGERRRLHARGARRGAGWPRGRRGAGGRGRRRRRRHRRTGAQRADRAGRPERPRRGAGPARSRPEDRQLPPSRRDPLRDARAVHDVLRRGDPARVWLASCTARPIRGRARSNRSTGCSTTLASTTGSKRGAACSPRSAARCCGSSSRRSAAEPLEPGHCRDHLRSHQLDRRASSSGGPCATPELPAGGGRRPARAGRGRSDRSPRPAFRR